MKIQPGRRPRAIGRLLVLAAIVAIVLAGGAPAVCAQDTLGAHIGFVLPLVTRADGQTTGLTDGVSVGFPLGVTFIKGNARMVYDLELVPSIQNTPRRTALTIHPGVVWRLGRYGLGIRAAFDVNSASYGFTPLFNRSWALDKSVFRSWFIEGVMPVRFNRPTGGLRSTPVSLGVHVGLGL